MSQIPSESKAKGKIGSKPIDDYLSEQVSDPKIAAKAKQTYTKQAVQTDELMTTPHKLELLLQVKEQ